MVVGGDTQGKTQDGARGYLSGGNNMKKERNTIPRQSN